jgi:hypothetical protein
MKTDTVIDYAMPLMNIERMSKHIHDLCLDGKYDVAVDEAIKLCAESRILQATLAIMHNKETVRANPQEVQDQR